MEYILQLDKMETVVSIIRLFIINLFTYYTSFKIIDKSIILKKGELATFIYIFILTVICKYEIDNLSFYYNIISIIIFEGILILLKTKLRIGYAMIVTTISLTINYILFTISTFGSFITFNLFYIKNDYINLVILLSIYTVLMIIFTRLKRINKGFTFLKKQSQNEYFDLLILNISCVILFSVILLSNYGNDINRSLGIALIMFIIMMAITIQKSLQLYYKQKMLVKDLEETKAELEEKNNKIKELEKEIIKSGKRSHSISHRQKILEHKLEELSMKSEISEMDIKSRIEKIGKDIRKEPVIVLAKTGIVEIDDVLNYMKSECLKKKIDFQLQLSGNIYKMINNYVSKDELEILLADHIKNAIIAIEHSENINKSILVRLGRLDGTYGLYVYDSGIEFEIETFLKLGKKPATTHKDSGGTGMGFMNTFDTLRKHNASFIIEEYGKPVTDNFTKVLKFKFDNKNEFNICTYRKEEIEKQDKEKILKVENLMF